MITSAPFDDWWHNAYGLDVKILSPPHVLLAFGMVAVEIGVTVLIAAAMNRTSGKPHWLLEMLFLYTSSMVLVALLVTVLEFTSRTFLHTAACYRAVCILTPVVLTLASRATGRRWAGTIVAGIYTAFVLGLLWILPRFPAQPKLGPVLHEITQFIPAGFPLLVVVPALALDLLSPRIRRWASWQQAIVTGAVFFAVLIAVEWPFATFLQSPLARNALFGSTYYDYFQNPQGYAATYRFIPLETPPEFRRGVVIAAVSGMMSAWVGLRAGDWLRRVRR